MEISVFYMLFSFVSVSLSISLLFSLASCCDCLTLQGRFSHFTYFLSFHLNHPECMNTIPDEDGDDGKKNSLKPLKYIPVIQEKRPYTGEMDPF